jgi:hypothetical protein
MQRIHDIGYFLILPLMPGQSAQEADALAYPATVKVL